MQIEFRTSTSTDRARPVFTNANASTVAERVRRYFETSGFSRWTAIYGTGDIPPIWKVIRDGHQRAADQIVG
ncbi:MAG: hypothetical protein NVSMB64_31630 [Candidatus Velthaea sp.]